MSSWKKFTDFFAVLGAFSAIIYLVSEFMPYEALGVDSLTGKVKAFFSAETKVDYFAYVILAVLFILSFVLSKIWVRFPTLHFGVALLPLMWSFFMFDADKLEERPMLYVISALLNAAGAFLDALLADRTDGKQRAFFATNVCSTVTAAFACFLYMRSKALIGVPVEDLNFFDTTVGTALDAGAVFSPYWRIALMFLLITVISFLLRGIYFLDTLISLIPTVYVLSHWHSKALPAYGACVAALSILCLLAKLILTLVVKPAPPQENGLDFFSSLRKKLSQIKKKITERKQNS